MKYIHGTKNELKNSPVDVLNDFGHVKVVIFDYNKYYHLIILLIVHQYMSYQLYYHILGCHPENGNFKMCYNIFSIELK